MNLPSIVWGRRSPRSDGPPASPCYPTRRWAFIGAILAITLVAGSFIGACRGGPGGVVLSTLTTSDFHSLAFHPQNPNTVFFGHHHGLLKSLDGGRTWQGTSLRGRNQDVMGLTISSREPQQMYAAGHDVFFVSSDGGMTWRSLRHDLPGTDIHGLTMDLDNPRGLFAFVVGYGLFRSSDAGSNWQFLSRGLPPDVMTLASAGGETLYAGSMGLGVLRSGDGGKTWAAANKGLEGRNAMGLAVDPQGRQTIYAGTEGGLFKSSDAGVSWRRLPFPGSNAVTIAISPSNSRVVMAIAVEKDQKGWVYRSEDGGETWWARP